MSEPAALPRPRQVTLAAGMIMAGSALVVVSVFERLAGLHGLETQESIQGFLDAQPGTGLGLDVEGVLAIIRVVSMVAAGCAAAAGVLGYHVLRGNRGARLGVTLLAVPLFFSGLVAGGFLSSLVAASAVMLWLEPSRDWFDGRPARTPAEHDRPPAQPETPPAGPPPPPRAAPRPQEGFGSVAPGSATSTVPPYAGVTIRVAPAGRPDAVLWACLLTWIFSALAALAMTALALVVLASPDLFFDELRRQDPDLGRDAMSDAALATAIYVTAAVTLTWSAVAAVLAVLVFRQVGWARVALVVCAAGAAAICLLGALGSLVMVAPLLACGATVALLLRREVRAWVAAP